VSRHPAASGRRREFWLRALLFSPLIVAALGVIAGQAGHLALPFDTVSGGAAPWSLGLAMALGIVGMAAFAIAALLMFAVLITHGIASIAGTLRRPAIILAVIMGSAYLLFQTVHWWLRDEMAAAVIAVERIDSTRWQATSCGRGRYVCLDWEGSAGRAQIKGYFAGPGAARDALDRWTLARSAGDTLSVEWGRTPRGWNVAKAAHTGTLTLASPWP
jgi:hypothetical protein